MSQENFSNWTGSSATEKTARIQTTSSYTLSTNLTASWCPNCGRRRGADGRCPDCDPWWTSPVVRYGAAIGVLVGLVLLGGITLSQSGNSSRVVRSLPGNGLNPTIPGVAPQFASPASPTGYTPTYSYVPASTPNTYSAATTYSTPAYTPQSLPPVNLAASLGPSTEELQRRAIEQLRQLTAYTDAMVDQQRQARWQQMRAAYQGDYQSSFASGGRGPMHAVPVDSTF